MKTYKISDKNHFLFKSLDVFKNFELYSGLEIYDTLEKNKNVIKYTEVKNLRFEEIPYDVPITRDNRGKITYRKTKLHTKEYDQPFLYHKPTDMNCYSLDEKPGYKRIQGFSSSYVNETYIRSIDTEDFYVYIQLPYRFLREHIGANIANADVQKYFKAIDTLKKITVENLIRMHSEFDEVYPEVSPFTTKQKSEKIPIWRKDIFPYMVYTLSKYGFYNPIILNKAESIFKDGSHRLTCGAAVKRDVPVLLKILRKDLQYGRSSYVTAPVMLHNRLMLFQVCLIDREVRGWYIDPIDLPKKGVMDFNKPT